MPRKISISAALILVGTVLSAARLFFGPGPWEAQAASLLALGLVLANGVNIVAMLLAPGRWVRNSIALTATAWVVVAVVLPVDPLWIGALVAHASGVASAWTGSLDPWFLQTKPDRVPVKAVVLALGLVWLPGLAGGLGIPEVSAGGWVLALFGLGSGWAYARAVPGALWAVRLVLPPLTAYSAVGLQLPAAVGVLAAGSTLTALAWTADARLAVRRPVPRRVETMPVLPELTPPGILESAGYDHRGRPLRRND